MIYLGLSVLLFGLVHPLSKVILETGIPLSYFCILFITFRLLLLTPMYLYKRDKIRDNKTLLLLLILGGFSAGVQYFEFKGIKEGLNPGLVTFLVFSYPVWILVTQLFIESEISKRSSMLMKVIAGIAGVYFISNSISLNLTGHSLGLLTYPILASIFMALWIGLSNKLSKQNIGSITLSFFCDLFSLIVLLGTLWGSLPGEWDGLVLWLTNYKYLFALICYSIFIGLIPNILFYKGSLKVATLTVGLTMTLEPVFSTLYSSFIWQNSLEVSFVIGALLIIFANLPIGLFKRN